MAMTIYKMKHLHIGTNSFLKLFYNWFKEFLNALLQEIEPEKIRGFLENLNKKS